MPRSIANAVTPREYNTKHSMMMTKLGKEWQDHSGHCRKRIPHLWLILFSLSKTVALGEPVHGVVMFVARVRVLFLHGMGMHRHISNTDN
jgi:hypothetical protein